MNVSRHRLALLGILLLALALRLALWSQPLHQLANDEVEYVQVGRDLLAGRGWIFYDSYNWLRAPLYPLFLAGSLWLFGGDLYFAALPNITLSVATVGLVYALAREIGNRRPGTGDRRQGTRNREQGTGDREHERRRTLSLSKGQWSQGAEETRNKRSTLNAALSTQPSIPLLAALTAALLWTFATFAGLYMSETLFTFLLAAATVLLLRWHRTARRWHDWRLLLAGVCYGLAVLTRSVPLAFLPVVLGWMLLVPVNSLRWAALGAWLRALLGRPAALLAPLVFACCVVLTIAPWTLRNCVAYGACITVETGLSYNLWAFSEPREDKRTIFRTLEAISNPAERADVATAKGMERLREDPTIVLRKLEPNWIALWRVKPIQDRFLQASYYADPPPLVFLGALVFDDALYLVIALAALPALALAVARGERAGLLLAAWLLYVVVTTLLTHGEGRYRHFFFWALIPYTARSLVTLAGWIKQRHMQQARRSALAATAVGGLLAVWVAATTVAYYPWGWAGGGAVRSVYRAAGDTAYGLGWREQAQQLYWNGLNISNTPDGWLALARVYRLKGEVDLEAQAYRAARSLAQPYAAPNALLGNLRREQGRIDEARAAFVGRYTAEQTMLDWSWDYLDPAPAARIDVGNGLDFGYVGGMYPAEELQGTTARWSNGQALLRVPGDAQAVRLHIAAPQPNATAVDVQLCVNDFCQPFRLASGWQIVALRIPPVTSLTQVVELRSPTFIAPDGRELGVIIDWLEAE